MGILDGIPILGDILGGVASYYGQKQTNATNRQIAAENRNWQQMMSNTSYRRSMRDMTKAGLNPILAYQQGGASTPAGSVIPMDNPAKDAASTGRSVSDHLLMAQRLKAEVQNLNTSSALNVAKSETEKTNQAANLASAAYTSANTVIADAEGKWRDDLLSNQWNLQNFESQIKANELSVKQAAAVLADLNKAIDSGQWGSMLAWMDRLGIKPGDLLSQLTNRLGRSAVAPTLNNLKSGKGSGLSTNPNSKGAPSFNSNGVIEGYTP